MVCAGGFYQNVVERLNGSLAATSPVTGTCTAGDSDPGARYWRKHGHFHRHRERLTAAAALCACRSLALYRSGRRPGFGTTSWLNYRDIRDQSQQLKTVAAYSEDIGVVETQNASQSVAAPRVTPNLFSMLDVQPLLGRTFTQSEGEAGASDVVLLSEGVWRQSFQADPAIVGKVVNISGKPHTVVGVMPSSFLFPESMEPDIRKGVWLPMKPTAEMSRDRGYHFQNVVAELRPGITTMQAQRELDAIAAHIPKTKSDNAVAFRATPYQEVLTGPVRPILYSLFAALVLGIVDRGSNVSNLLIARCLGRQKEFAVRAALGASRLRLVRQLLSEGMMQRLAGCGVGVILAQLAMVAMRKLPEGTIPRADSIAIHWTVVLALAVIAIVTTVLSSLLPALLVARANPQAALQAASRGIGSRSVSRRRSGWLVAGEVALSTLLLVGTGLLFHTLWNLQQSRLGFETARVTTFVATPANAAGFSGMAIQKTREMRRLLSPRSPTNLCSNASARSLASKVPP